MNLIEASEEKVLPSGKHVASSSDPTITVDVAPVHDDPNFLPSRERVAALIKHLESLVNSKSEPAAARGVSLSKRVASTRRVEPSVTSSAALANNLIDVAADVHGNHMASKKPSEYTAEEFAAMLAKARAWDREHSSPDMASVSRANGPKLTVSPKPSMDLKVLSLDQLRTHRRGRAGLMQDLVGKQPYINIAIGAYVPPGFKTRQEIYLCEAESAQAMADTLRGYAAEEEVQSMNAIAPISDGILDQHERSPLPGHPPWGSEDLAGWQITEVDKMILDWLQKGHSWENVERIGAMYLGRVADVHHEKLRQRKMHEKLEREVALVDPMYRDVWDVKLNEECEKWSREVQEAQTGIYLASLASSEHTAVAELYSGHGDNPNDTSPHRRANDHRADHSLHSIEDPAIEAGKIWMPLYIRQLPPLPAKLTASIPSLMEQESFSHSFLLKMFGDHVTQFNHGTYWISKKVRSLISGNLFYLLDAEFEPFLPQQPGEHGAKLSPFFNPEEGNGKNDAPATKNLLDAPVFISDPMDKDTRFEDKKFKYYGQYSQTRHSDQLDYDRMTEVVPHHIKE